MLKLNNENYYSREADLVYMSNSQYKDFITCEAMAMAKLAGTWKEPSNDNLLLGSYVHSWLEGTLENFKKDNPSLFTKKGDLYAQYRVADQMIEALKNDEFIMFVLQGQKEVIITAEFAGTWWKAKLDTYNPTGGRFADLKTVKAIRERHWDKKLGVYVSFAEAYGYLRQLSLYAELERLWVGRDHWLEPLIVAVSKEDPPDKEIIGVDTDRMQMELDEIQQNMDRILLVKNGFEEPIRCGECRFCRETKKINRVVHYMDLVV